MKAARPASRIFSSTSAPRPLKRVPKNSSSIVSVKQLHGHLIRTQLHTDPDLMEEVIRSYALSPVHLRKALLAFDHIERPTLPLWNHLIRGLSQGTRPIEAVHWYIYMRRRCVPVNNSIFTFLIGACARISNIALGQQIHCHVLKSGFDSFVFASNALINFYSCCGLVGFARKVFDKTMVRDLVSWNSMICGYSQCNKFAEVLALFDALQLTDLKADAVTMMKVILACIRLGNWEYADSAVGYMELVRNNIEIDLYLGNTLIDMYGQRGLCELAQGVFDRMLESNIVSWNSMIVAHSKAGNLVAARQSFNDMPRRDVISWTSMINAYSQANQFPNAVRLFREMMCAKVKPDEFTATAVLSACAHLGWLDVGVGVHDYIREHGMKVDIHVGNSLIDMYCKCGVVERALEVFHEMELKDSVSWSSVISGLAVNGFSDSAVDFFSKMLREGVWPNHGAFIGVLQACTHAGLVDEGLGYFESMEKVHRLVPEMKHYGCVVDLLSRSGQLMRAFEFLKKMPLCPDGVLWRTLLSACQLHGDVALAEIAINEIVQLDRCNSANYILLSNAYAGAGRYVDASKMREMMEDDYVQKPTGFSSIDALLAVH